MLNMRIDTMLATLVRQLLVDAEGRDKEALYFNLDLRLGYKVGVKQTYNSSRRLHLLYHRRPTSMYVDVFAAATKILSKLNDVQKFDHVSTHDACWKDIKIFSKIYLDMVSEINNMLRSDGHSETSPINMQEQHSFHDLAFIWIPVQVHKDPHDKNNYRKTIAIVK